MPEEFNEETSGGVFCEGLSEESLVPYVEPDPIRNPQVTRLVNGVLRPVAEQLINVVYLADATMQQVLDPALMETLGITIEDIASELFPEDFEDAKIDDGRIDQGIPLVTRAKVLRLVRVIAQLNGLCKATQYGIPEYVKKVAFDLAANPPIVR